MTSIMAMGLRIGVPIGSFDGISCSTVFVTATFVPDLNGEPRKEAFLEPPPSGEPKIDIFLEEGDARKEARLIEEVMR